MNYAYRHVRTYENREFIKISFYRQTILDLGIDNLTRSRIRLIPFEIAYSACNIYAIKAIFTRLKIDKFLQMSVGEHSPSKCI